MKIYAKISKVDEDSRVVEGYASTESMDSQGEVVTRGAITAALADYMKFANVREMHQPSAVGKTQSAVMDEHGLYIAVKVVDDDAWKKVKEQVYNGFSIGGKATLKNANRIEALELAEISLVDRPACPDAVFSLWKADGMPMKIEKSAVASAVAEVAHAVLAKGCNLYPVSELADILQRLSWITTDSEWDKQYEGDDSKVPAMLRAGYAQLAEALKAMAVEETAEAIADQAAQVETGAIALADAPTDVVKSEDAAASDLTAFISPAFAASLEAKFGKSAVLSDEQKNALKVVWKLVEEAGLAEEAKAEAAPAADAEAVPAAEEPVEDEAEKAATAEALAKAAISAAPPATDTVEKAALDATIAKLNGENATLAKRVADLEALPAATVGVLRVLNRDGTVAKAVTVQQATKQDGMSAKDALEKMFSGELGMEPIRPIAS